MVAPVRWRANGRGPYRFPSQTRGSSAGTAPNNASTGAASSGSGAGEGEQVSTLSLSVTVAVGCSLLFLNILIFAGMYYHKDRRRMAYLVTKREIENKASESQRLHDDTCKTSSYQDSETNCSSSIASVPYNTTPWSKQHHSSSCASSPTPHNITSSTTSTHPKTAIPVITPNPPTSNPRTTGFLPNKMDSYSSRTHASQQAAAQSLSRPHTPDNYNRESIKLKDSSSGPVRENHHNQTNPVTMV